MKIAIYRHVRGCCLIPETVDPVQVLGERIAMAALCRETTLQELIRAGLTETADLVVSRMYLDLPFDVADDIIDRLNCGRELAVMW